MSRQQRQAMAPLAQRLCVIVQRRPGIHFRGLARAANISSAGQLRHHIDSLGRRGALIEVQEGRFKRFFVPSDHDARARMGLARFARPVHQSIGRLLLGGPMNRAQLRRALSCADSTLGHNLSRMIAAGDVARTPVLNQCLYSLTDPEFVRELLKRQADAHADASEFIRESTPAADDLVRMRDLLERRQDPANPSDGSDGDSGPGTAQQGRDRSTDAVAAD